MFKHIRTRSIYLPERIIEAMSGILDYPLTIIEAPMGYGKTTAVRKYLDSTGVTVLWQRVYDSSTTGFWSGFSPLFAQVDAALSHSLLQLGFPNDSVSLQEALKLIMSIELRKKTVLVIDDYHLLKGAEVSNFIKFLVVNEIDNLHVVLTARFVERISTEELALKGYLRHITKETFELIPDDIVKYYKLCGIRLKDTEAEKLYSTTEGWISALYLLMLNYKEAGSLIITTNIQKLLEKAVYEPLSEEIKDFLLNICIFNTFTQKQAKHMWGNENAERLLSEITGKNAFINYDTSTKTYHIHNIFTNFLQEQIAEKDIAYKRDIYEKAGQWCMGTGEYLAAMHYFYTAGDFENLLQVVELDKTNSFGNERKELLIKYFEECPEQYKGRHLAAVLAYGMCLMTLNEMELFEKVCREFIILMQSSSLENDSINQMMGEFELLMSFTKYNDIKGMTEYHKKACTLLTKPSVFMDTKGSWTFGSPSVLYLFYRESGKLEKEVQELNTAMPYYYQLTNNHGIGADHIMAAEWYFNKGDFENTEINVHKALCTASGGREPNIVICALFLQARLSLMKGDYANIRNLFEDMHEEVEQKRNYDLLYTIEMCTGFVNACLKQKNKISQWLAEGDFDSSRLYFQAKAFSNIIYGRVLLIKGDYLKLLGISEQFIGIASIFPNLLSNIYTTIYIAAANERIYRRGEALEAVKQALDMAIPDKLYIPFVENCDYIEPLLEELYSQGTYREDINRIIELSKPYQKSVELISMEYFRDNKPKLTKRETEIAQLAVDGFSNRGIGEKLFVSENTVKKHLKNIFEKLEVSSRSLLKQHFAANS